MSIHTEKNTSVKVTKKLSNHMDLEIEIERMWGMKALTIPVQRVGGNKHQIPGNIKIRELEKITLLRTSLRVDIALESENL